MYYTNNASSPFTNQNVSIGYEALVGSTTPADNTGNSNVAIGYQTMLKTAGITIMLLGSMRYTTIPTVIKMSPLEILLYSTIRLGQSNIAIGGASLSVNSTGSDNLALGINALFFNTTGIHNVALGNNSLMINSIGNNTAIGYQSFLCQYNRK